MFDKWRCLNEEKKINIASLWENELEKISNKWRDFRHCLFCVLCLAQCFCIKSPWFLYKGGIYYPHFTDEERGLKWFSGWDQTNIATDFSSSWGRNEQPKLFQRLVTTHIYFLWISLGLFHVSAWSDLAKRGDSEKNLGEVISQPHGLLNLCQVITFILLPLAMSETIRAPYREW